MTGREPPTEEQVARIFRSLAEDHAATRGGGSKEASWRRLQIKWQDRVRERSSGWLIFPDWRIKVGALAAACALALTLIHWPAPRDLSFELRGETSAVVDDGWIRAETTDVALDFSDGSVVELARGTLLNVNVLGAHSALARISNGKITADVHHAETTNWSFLAGPYEVRVVGTAFELSWQDSHFSLFMRDGQVRVSGPNQQAWVVSKGESLDLPPAQPKPTSVTSSAAAPDPALDEPVAAATNVASLPRPRQPKAIPAGNDWSKLLAIGKFQRIVQDAKSRGIDDILGSASTTDLAALAQAASYTGENALAKNAWRKLRDRFPGSSSGTRGSFFLARLEERQGQQAEAVRWLDTYLREAPGGVYAAEAHGRKLVLTRRMSGANSPRARKLAREYLERFPQGAYAETARATLAHR